MKTTAVQADPTVRVTDTCDRCGHPATGVKVLWWVECAHGETDDGIGDVSPCGCRNAAHRTVVVKERVIW